MSPIYSNLLPGERILRRTKTTGREQEKSLALALVRELVEDRLRKKARARPMPQWQELDQTVLNELLDQQEES